MGNPRAWRPPGRAKAKIIPAGHATYSARIGSIYGLILNRNLHGSTALHYQLFEQLLAMRNIFALQIAIICLHFFLFALKHEFRRMPVALKLT
jgi:hypothetical protein